MAWNSGQMSDTKVTDIPPMLGSPDLWHAFDISRDQSRHQEEGEAIVERIMSRPRSERYTAEDCTELARQAGKVKDLSTKAALLERNYSQNGYKQYQAELEVSA
jgi:hypothetical protein